MWGEGGGGTNVDRGGDERGRRVKLGQGCRVFTLPKLFSYYQPNFKVFF